MIRTRTRQALPVTYHRRKLPRFIPDTILHNGCEDFNSLCSRIWRWRAMVSLRSLAKGFYQIIKGYFTRNVTRNRILMNPTPDSGSNKIQIFTFCHIAHPNTSTALLHRYIRQLNTCYSPLMKWEILKSKIYSLWACIVVTVWKVSCARHWLTEVIPISRVHIEVLSFLTCVQ